MTSPDFLLAGCERIYPDRARLIDRLQQAAPLRLYLGIDPTNLILHLGHTVPLRLLKRFQNAGHTVVLLIGDFTATVGDPSGRDTQRSVLTRATVETNVLALKEQLFQVLDEAKTELRYNSEWYDDVDRLGTVRKLMELGHSFTVAQLAERDLFQVRQTKQQPVSVTEFLYPMLQAYDSVALNVDVEVGGTDQTFNMLAGRTLLKQIKGKEKFVITLPLILGTDGRKMSKSYGNTIGVNDAAPDMFGKLMSISDDQILPYMTHLTDRFQSGVEREEFKQMIADSPRDAKAVLAREIVELYHGTESAIEAERTFNATFRDHVAPTNVDHKTFSAKPLIVEYLVEQGFSPSRSAARILILQGAVTVGDQKITDPTAELPLTKEPIIIKVGPHRFSSASLTE